jgi:Arc/MetJ-type ribon-helix-helix transcriptional regulator
MAGKLVSRHVTWNQATEGLLEAELRSGRFANLSEAVRAAIWHTFGDEASRAELERLIDEALEDPRPAIPLKKLKRRRG